LSSTSSLYRHRWAIPIVAALGADGGSRFVPLRNRLGIGRETLRQTLDALIADGLVIRNPGYGHPSRPEYLLTAAGGEVAPACADLVRLAKRAGVDDVVFRRWSLPVIGGLVSERRFADVRRAVGATPRALSLSLKELVAAGVVERRVHDGFPPATSYRLTDRGRRLARPASAVAEVMP
jgi:DNA-binding HxlR family transcriptional regulator